MTLDQNQIAEIKSLITRKGVKYLDVQMEIIDHTASAVEERLNANPDLSFEQALKQTHASFGIFGFGGMEDAIVSGMGKRYNRIFMRRFLSFLGIKYIGLVLLGGILLYQGQILAKDYVPVVSIILIATVALIGILVVVGLNHKGHQKFLVYGLSVRYLMFIGTFLQLFNLLMDNVADVIIFGLNRNFLMVSALLTLFILYVATAIYTAAVGVRESKSLMEKYNLLNH
ncbi:MAG: hypothetical protein EOO90_09045 [Pedobacter sp.]|nr:MAG: hypothetical protein EOO90_09045 [Pedobacter sp.]